MFKLHCLRSDRHAGAVGFVISMLIVGFVVAGLVGAFAYQISVTQADTAIAGGNLSNSSAGDGVGGGADDITYGGVAGGAAMLGLLAMLFIVIPVVIFAKAAT